MLSAKAGSAGVSFPLRPVLEEVTKSIDKRIPLHKIKIVELI